MDSFARSESIHALLENSDRILPEQVDQAIKLGLADEDFQINEDTWKYLLKNKKVLEYTDELAKMAKRMLNSSEIYYLKLGQKILSLVDIQSEN
jgi:hypothetical protein